jgi:hypothetical protein
MTNRLHLVKIRPSYNTASLMQRWTNVSLDRPYRFTDRRHAAAANTTYNAHGLDSPNFYPGDRLNGTAGVSVRF